MGLYFDRVGRNDCTLGDAVEYLKWLKRVSKLLEKVIER